MSSQELLHLAAHYRTNASTMTDKQKAEIEKRLWDLTGPEDRQQKRYVWLKAVCGADENRASKRATILAFGSSAEVLWDRMAKQQMLLGTAATLVSDARLLAEAENLKLGEALHAAIERYDALPNITYVGVVPLRKKAFTRGRSRAAAVAENGDKVFWTALKGLISKHLDSKLKGVEPFAAETISKEFEVSLKIAFEDLKQRIRTMQRRENISIEVMGTALTKRDVEDACAALSMSPPHHIGDPIDMEKAKQQKKRLALLYHPDIKGDTSAQQNLDEVVKAYKTLEAYTLKYNSKTPKIGEENGSGTRNE